MTTADWFWIGLLTGLALAWTAVRLGRHHRDQKHRTKEQP